MHARSVQTEELVVPKKGLGGGVVLVTGHDEPVQRFSVAFAGCGDFFRENLKKRFLLQRRNRESAFGSIITQARALATGDGEGSDATGAQSGFARRFSLSPFGRVATMGRQFLVRRGLEIGEVDGGSRGLHKQRFIETIHFGQVDLGGLCQETLLGSGV